MVNFILCVFYSNKKLKENRQLLPRFSSFLFYQPVLFMGQNEILNSRYSHGKEVMRKANPLFPVTGDQTVAHRQDRMVTSFYLNKICQGCRQGCVLLGATVQSSVTGKHYSGSSAGQVIRNLLLKQ